MQGQQQQQQWQKQNKNVTKIGRRRHVYCAAVATLYLNVCVCVCVCMRSCFMLPTNTALRCFCCCSRSACCNTINFRFCLSSKVASCRAVLTSSLRHFTLPLPPFCFVFVAAACCYCVFIIGGCIFMERKQQLSCQCHCSNMTYT